MFAVTQTAQCHVLIPCAGQGARFGGAIPKQYHLLMGKKVLQHSLDAFLAIEAITSIWVACDPVDLHDIANTDPKVQVLRTGGQTRAQTVLNTLRQLVVNNIPATDWILVHDAARPGISPQDIQTLITQVTREPNGVGGILALPMADTVKESEATQTKSQRTLDRTRLWQAQTPQMFRLGDIIHALEAAEKNHTVVTDEASALEAVGKQPLLVRGSLHNFKITYAEDLKMMANVLQTTPVLRIGQGYDVHRLVAGRALRLGGIAIPFHMGLLGHSDADALLHAITDALIGAAGLGNIGQHFPDTDPQYHAIDSAALLDRAYLLVKQEGYTVINIDASIVCQAPKLASYLPAMVNRIGEILDLSPSLINIKAKTNEGLGYLGRSEAIETQVVLLLQKNSAP